MRHLNAGLFALCALLNAPAAAETVRVNGIDLHYEVSGAGEPLLLLHGFGSCAAEWRAVTAEFAKRYRVIAVDQRGHGQSTNPSGRFTHRQSAEDIRALMDSLGTRKARAFGFSSGGMTLLQLAVKYPDRLSKLVIVSATTHFPDEARSILRGASLETMPPPVREQYQRCAARGEPQMRELVAQFASFADSRDDMNLTASDLGRIKASTLIVHGDRDEFFPVGIPVAMYAGIAGSELWIVPGGGHSPPESADEAFFLKTVGSFLAK